MTRGVVARCVGWCVVLAFVIVFAAPSEAGDYGRRRDYGEKWDLFSGRGLRSTLIFTGVCLGVCLIASQHQKSHRRSQEREVAIAARGLEDTNPEVADAAVATLASYGQRAIPAAAALLTHKDPAVRARAVAVLGRVAHPDAIPALVRALADADPAVRAASAKTLGMKGQVAVQPLIGALEDPDPSVRASAAQALGVIGDRSAMRPLWSVMRQDTDGTVREAARSAFRRIGSLRRSAEAVTATAKTL